MLLQHLRRVEGFLPHLEFPHIPTLLQGTKFTTASLLCLERMVSVQYRGLDLKLKEVNEDALWLQ